jgi:choline kinase
LLEHSLLSLSKCGVNEAVIVVGYLADQVKRRIGDYNFGIEIRYIFNPNYNFHSSQYSLSLAEPELGDADTLVMEGDILLHRKLLPLILDHKNSNSVLVDTRKSIEASRSVIVLGKNGIVERFVFDPSHEDVFDLIDDRSRIVGESLQVWKFSISGSRILARDLRHYRDRLGKQKDSRTNLYSINRAIQLEPMHYIDSLALPWRNINTIHDIEMAETMDLEG